jgi:hypothetical protein
MYSDRGRTFLKRNLQIRLPAPEAISVPTSESICVFPGILISANKAFVLNRYYGELESSGVLSTAPQAHLLFRFGFRFLFQFICDTCQSVGKLGLVRVLFDELVLAPSD